MDDDATATADYDNGDAAVHQLTHYWYSTWPDHQTPQATDQLLRLVLEVERLRLNAFTDQRPRPVIVHCRSSASRSLIRIKCSVISLPSYVHFHSIQVKRLKFSLTSFPLLFVFFISLVHQYSQALFVVRL